MGKETKFQTILNENNYSNHPRALIHSCTVGIPFFFYFKSEAIIAAQGERSKVFYS